MSQATAGAQTAVGATTKLGRVFGTSVGKKLVMAVTGVILSGFVLVHMLGNLTAFQSESAFNAYATGLRKILPALWAARLVLLGSVVLHSWAFLTLMRQSRAARPAGYRVTAWQASDYASRAMRVTGPLLFVFIVYHLLHMTFGTVHPDFREFGVDSDGALAAQAYHNLVTGLRIPVVAVVYLVALAMLGLHLFHGVWSMFQTLGFSQPRRASAARRLAVGFVVVVCGGFALVPLAVMTGMLR